MSEIETDAAKSGRWRRISVQARQTVGFWTDKGNIEAQFKERFDKTKAVSDFVGMIVRFAFALAATAYFGRRVLETAPGIRWYALAFCWTTSIGITISLGSGIAGIIFAYEMRAVGDSKRSITRLIFFVLAVSATLCLWYGLNDLAGVIGGSFPTAPKK